MNDVGKGIETSRRQVPSELSVMSGSTLHRRIGRKRHCISRPPSNNPRVNIESPPVISLTIPMLSVSLWEGSDMKTTRRFAVRCSSGQALLYSILFCVNTCFFLRSQYYSHNGELYEQIISSHHEEGMHREGLQIWLETDETCPKSTHPSCTGHAQGRDYKCMQEVGEKVPTLVGENMASRSTRKCKEMEGKEDEGRQ